MVGEGTGKVLERRPSPPPPLHFFCAERKTSKTAAVSLGTWVNELRRSTPYLAASTGEGEGDGAVIIWWAVQIL